jgi:alanyl-tRNA synthetase
MALFGEKYGDRVRVMRIGPNSIELCGGTHVRRTGDIGLFKLTQETGIAQGIRRVEAVTGQGALEYLRQIEGELQRAATAMRAAPTAVADAAQRLQKELKERDRRIEDLQRKMALAGVGAAGASGDLMSRVKESNGIKVLSARTEVSDPKALREVADQLRTRLGSGDGDKVSRVAAVTADLVGRLHAGKIIADVARQVGGKGGGRPDLAQAGGSDASKLDEALASVYAMVT